MPRKQVTGTVAAQTEVEVTGVLDVGGSEALLAKLDRSIDEGRYHLALDVTGPTRVFER